ncbi:ferrochelatase [Thermosporothrix hazakensis]|jgi:ferrochelatase|uniref:Ferrochelatase n=2 Tax=Thermosporothrix TaxID=768650 RepID=A0A326U3E2_THEHA|nr:ferrochelatase [Thermosporothrix hazakensis]PZW26599.1 ferrochelatase [Thermosporothrix hazakensis]BBH89518.1 ferrochelatase [Thermosporothrix sp. COM3]GCE47700.1 ferrochelatase [Thermosporothrix hazakensis]
MKQIGVLLMTYGSPERYDDVPAFMKNVYGGREPSPELVAEFRRRYELIGGSPLVRITREQAAALQEELNSQSTDGTRYHVGVGMRFSPPFITDAVPEVAADVQTLVGLVMSPQFSPIIMNGYVRTLEDAVADLERSDLSLKIARDWHLQPYFIEATARRVKQALEQFPAEIREKVPVLLSAHSMPKRVVENEPDYINALKETAAAVAQKAGLANDRWMFCYQSAGHTPEEWLKPDFADLMPELKQAGHTHVLIAPVQFLADHLEILYDIEVGAREQAEEHGLVFARTESLNTDPLFIKALAAVVQETLTANS